MCLLLTLQQQTYTVPKSYFYSSFSTLHPPFWYTYPQIPATFTSLRWVNKTTMFCLRSSSLYYGPKSSSRRKARVIGGLTLLVFLPLDITVLHWMPPHVKKQPFNIFYPVFIFYSRRASMTFLFHYGQKQKLEEVFKTLWIVMLLHHLRILLLTHHLISTCIQMTDILSSLRSPSN